MLKEMFAPFFIGTGTFIMLFQINFLMFFFKTFSAQNVPFLGVLQLMIYNTPDFMRFSIPVGTAMGTSLALARLTRESELTALRAGTASIKRALRMVVAVGLLMAGIAFVNLEYLKPRAAKHAAELGRKLGTLGALPNFATNQSIKVKNFTVNVGTVSRQGAGNVLLSNLMLVERQEQNQLLLITADSGMYENGVWTIKNPVTFMINGQDVVSVAPDKKEMVINEKIALDQIFGQSQPEEETIKELQKSIEMLKQGRQSSVVQELALYERYSLPVACLIFAIVSPLFSIRFARQGAFIGVVMSMLVVGLYYNAYVVSNEIIGKQMWLPPIVASWLPNIVFVVLGGIASLRME